MKNSIEKDIEIINNFIAYFNKNIQNGYKADLTVLGEEIEALEHILSDYKKVVKENEYMHNELNKQQTTINKYAKENKELKQDRNNNYQMIALAQNGALRYMQGYEDGKKLKRSAVANIVENQQYYIFNKQIEYYKEYIVNLQKENTEFEKLSKDCSYSVDIVRENTRLRRQVFDLELENEKLKKTATNRSE